ncbi:MAG: hypothetical protein J0I12_21020 [Candidatus Eremiobacteraeota bacterium]|nr:hypothetical protein [Candidatus Eremiobacteraeota bacterium]
MKRKGYSLMELIAAQAVLGVCLLGIASLVRAGSRYMMVTNAKTELQKSALLTIRHIVQEFQETNDGSFTTGTSAAVPTTQSHYGVVFASPRDPKDGSVNYDQGRLVWCKYVCFYKRDINGVPSIVRTVAKLDPKVPYPPPCDALDTFLLRDYGITVVADHITTFECWKASANLLILLRADLPSNYGKNYGFQVETQVFARN